jgi:predicted nucleotidyltransferase
MDRSTFTPAERDDVLTGVAAQFENDDRIEAAVVTGSLGAGNADRWSDIDLALLVGEGHDCPAVADDWISRLYAELSVVHHYEAAFDTTLVRGMLLDSGLLLDLAFTPAPDFSIWAPVRVLFDRTGRATALAAAPVPWAPTPDWAGQAGFGFHDVIHCATAAARGRPWRALFYLQRVRNRTLSLASERHGWDAAEFARVDELPPAERDPLLASLVSDLEPAALLAALDSATRSFLAELQRGDPRLAARLEPVLLQFVALVQGRRFTRDGADVP